MHACAAAGAAFLIAVLWFDLMFDVQVRGARGARRETLPADVLASIGAYYRRVTTQAAPMSRLIPLVMALTVAAILAEIVQGRGRSPVPWISLAAAASAIGLALARTVRDAMRLGRGADPPDVQSRLARSVLRDHLYCLAAMSLTAGLQLTAPLWA